MATKAVIFLGGKQGSGKDNAARVLHEYFLSRGVLAEIFRFADPVYEIHDIIQKYMSQFGYVPERKKGKLLQKVGTEIGREVYGEDVWVDIASKRIDKYLKSAFCEDVGGGASIPEFSKAAIIVDNRFPNEVDARKQFEDSGYKTIALLLKAPEEVRRSRTDKFREDTNHPSEIGLDGHEDKFDKILDTSEPLEVTAKVLLDIAAGLVPPDDPIDELQFIVDQFNTAFQLWREVTKQGANLGWKYRDAGHVKDMFVINSGPDAETPTFDVVRRAEALLAKISEENSGPN